jgi:hypothetical protein
MVHIRKASQREEIDEFRKEVKMLGNTVSLPLFMKEIT